jgi:hypothetical protein
MQQGEVAVLSLFLFSIVLAVAIPVSGFVTVSEKLMLLIVMKLSESRSIFNWGGGRVRGICHWDSLCIAQPLALAAVSTVHGTQGDASIVTPTPLCVSILLP